MIVLQNQKRPLSTDFFIEKKDPFFFKTLTFKDSNRTLFLQNTDFHRVEITFEDFKGPCLGLSVWDFLNSEKIDPPFFFKCEYLRGKWPLFIQNREHTNFTKIDPFSADFRMMMCTYL